jgi:hypothetical protein
MQSILSLFEKVSLFKALRRLSPKSSLLELDVRSYMACHARVLMISDKEKISYANNAAHTLLSLLNRHFRQFLH